MCFSTPPQCEEELDLAGVLAELLGDLHREEAGVGEFVDLAGEGVDLGHDRRGGARGGVGGGGVGRGRVCGVAGRGWGEAFDLGEGGGGFGGDVHARRGEAFEPREAVIGIGEEFLEAVGARVELIGESLAEFIEFAGELGRGAGGVLRGGSG